MLPEAAGGGIGGHHYDFRGATFAGGAHGFGEQARGGTVHQGLDAAAIGALAELISRLEALRPAQPPEAATAIDEAVQVLKNRPTADAAGDRWTAWRESALATLATLGQKARDVTAIVTVIKIGRRLLGM